MLFTVIKKKNFKMKDDFYFFGVKYMVLIVKNVPANEGDVREASSIHGWERSLGWDHGTHSSILAWRAPWTEKLGRLWSIRSQRVRHD